MKVFYDQHSVGMDKDANSIMRLAAAKQPVGQTPQQLARGRSNADSAHKAHFSCALKYNRSITMACYFVSSAQFNSK